MNSTAVILVIALAMVGAFILYRFLKPYLIKYDTTLFITGGLGSGKTLTAVKTAIVLIRKTRWKLKWKNRFRKLANLFRRWHNWHNKWLHKKGKIRIIKEPYKMPKIYSNIPIHFKPHWYSSYKDREWAEKLTAKHILLLEAQEEFSITLIDEQPQVIDQFNWNLTLVKNNFTEYCTFYRHYIGGFLICTAQSTSEIVAPLRRKANQAMWCFNFKKYFWGLFYSMECADIMLSDDVSTMATTQIEENTRKLWGFFPPRNTYNTRCYKYRYSNVLNQNHKNNYRKIFTNEILRVKEYLSPLDDWTTIQQKRNMEKDIENNIRRPN